eukprot:TRINITY_DN11136_c0_g1_i1.p1 TRINITY_DN11136_c0_g1~~TRINITY_DN11136_c0_g1_i1.p1  ORF type:complete len:768 (+),score=120.12 TRINITY_DN11136_c0_g1_i1:101-2404(+)
MVLDAAWVGWVETRPKPSHRDAPPARGGYPLADPRPPIDEDEDVERTLDEHSWLLERLKAAVDEQTSCLSSLRVQFLELSARSTPFQTFQQSFEDLEQLSKTQDAKYSSLISNLEGKLASAMEMNIGLGGMRDYRLDSLEASLKQLQESVNSQAKREENLQNAALRFAPHPSKKAPQESQEVSVKMWSVLGTKVASQPTLEASASPTDLPWQMWNVPATPVTVHPKLSSPQPPTELPAKIWKVLETPVMLQPTYVEDVLVSAPVLAQKKQTFQMAPEEEDHDLHAFWAMHDQIFAEDMECENVPSSQPKDVEDVQVSAPDLTPRQEKAVQASAEKDTVLRGYWDRHDHTLAEGIECDDSIRLQPKYVEDVQFADSVSLSGEQTAEASADERRKELAEEIRRKAFALQAYLETHDQTPRQGLEREETVSSTCADSSPSKTRDIDACSLQHAPSALSQALYESTTDGSDNAIKRDAQAIEGKVATPPVIPAACSMEACAPQAMCLEDALSFRSRCYPLPPSTYTTALLDCVLSPSSPTPCGWMVRSCWAYSLHFVNLFLQIGCITLLGRLTLWQWNNMEFVDCYQLEPVPLLCCIFLFICTIVNEVEECKEMLTILWKILPTTEVTSPLRFRFDAAGFLHHDASVGGMTACRKLFLLLLVILPRFLIAVAILLVGSLYLATSASNAEMLLNCVALVFILDIDDLLFKTLASSERVRLLQAMPIFKVDHEAHCPGIDGHKTQSLRRLLFGSLLTAIVFLFVPQCDRPISW